MNQQATPSDTDQQQALEAFLRDGGTLAMLRGLSEDTLEQLYALGFNQYQAGKWDDAQKIFQALCMLDHYDARYFSAWAPAASPSVSMSRPCRATATAR